MPIVSQSNKGPAKPDVFDVLMGDSDKRPTPLFDRLKKGPDSPTATLFQWPFEIPDNPTTTGSREGVPMTAASATVGNNPGLMFGRMHYFHDKFSVGEVTAGDKTFGMSGDQQYAYRARRSLRKAIVSAEAVLVGNQESNAGSDAAEFRTRGLELCITPTADIAAQTDTPTVIPVEFRPSAAQAPTLTLTGGDYALTDAHLTDAFGAIYDSLGAKIDLDLYCTRKFKGKVSGWGRLQPTPANFTAVARFNDTSLNKKITATIDTYEGDCGVARLDLHPMLRRPGTGQKAEAQGLHLSYMQLRVRQQPMAKKLDDRSNGLEGYSTWTMGLQCTPKFQAAWKVNTGS
jgi:hypothetical protein